MFDLESNARAIDRAAKKTSERYRRAFEAVMNSPEGRTFVMYLAVSQNLYDTVDTPEEEGARRVAVSIRNSAIEYGLFDKWQLAEREDNEFKTELKRILDQTEAKSDEEI